MNIPDTIRDRAAEYGGMFELSTGGDLDYIVKRWNRRTDLVLADADGEGSPEGMDAPAVVLNIRSDEEPHDWAFDSEVIFSGTAAQCLNYMASHAGYAPVRRRLALEMSDAAYEELLSVLKYNPRLGDVQILADDEVN